MRKLNKIALSLYGMLLATSFGACSNDDETKLEEKWQMRQIIHSNGEVEPVDSIFYNFMKGTFSAICITEEGNYAYYNGIYSLSEGRIRVTLKESDALNLAGSRHAVVRHMHWTGTDKEFQLGVLNGSSLQLVSGDYTYVFRKY